MKFAKGDTKSRYDFYNYLYSHGIITGNNIRIYEDSLELIDKMIKQVEDLKFIVETQQMLNNRMLEIMSEMIDI